MNLSNLRPAWHRFRLLNSMQSVDQQEILVIIERAEAIAITKTNRSIVVIAMFIVLTFCCQGG